MVSNFCKAVSTACWGQLERKSMQVPKSEVVGKEVSEFQIYSVWLRLFYIFFPMTNFISICYLHVTVCSSSKTEQVAHLFKQSKARTLSFIFQKINWLLFYLTSQYKVSVLVLVLPLKGLPFLPRNFITKFIIFSFIYSMRSTQTPTTFTATISKGKRMLKCSA